jgi:hypothetical protein
VNRCPNCQNMLRFYGISQTKTEGWMRWDWCGACGYYIKSNSTTRVGVQSREPSKAIFIPDREPLPRKADADPKPAVRVGFPLGNINQ